MREVYRTGWAIAIAVGLAATAVACGGGSLEGQRAHGVIKSVDAGARKVTIDHEDIPGHMNAMTMVFDVAPGVKLDGLRPGVEVDFWVKEEDATYTVTEIRRSGA